MGLANKAQGYPGSILVWLLTNHCWLPPVGLIIVTQHHKSVLTFVTRLFSNLWAKQSRNKCIVAKVLWTEPRSEWTDMELQHLFFDSTEELSRQGYFQWIYSLQAAGTPEISVQPCLSFSSGNPQNVTRWNSVRSACGAGKQQRIQHSNRVSRFYSQNIRIIDFSSKAVAFSYKPL